MGRERNAPLEQHPAWLGKLDVHLPVPPLPCGKNLGWDGLWSEVVLLCRRADSGKTKLFLLPTPVSPNSSIFLLPQSTGTSLLETWMPTKPLLSMGNISVFSRGFSLQLRKARARSQASWHGPQPGQRSLCLLSDARVGKTPPGSFGV